MFAHVRPYAGDPILGLMETFTADPRHQKVNLGVGIYYDEDGRIPVLPSVGEAARAVARDAVAATYLPIEGDSKYRSLVADLLFGDAVDSVRRSLAILQSVGGSGALKVGADFLRQHFPESTVHVSDPTWDNHLGIFEGAGFPVKRYRYYDPATKGLDFDGLLEDLRKAKPGDVVLLHACCHNPTGVDPDWAQWTAILDVVEELSLLPFVDTAYQGFGGGLEEDARVIRELARRRLNFMVSNSFSKNFSLYGERCGTLVVHCAEEEQRENVLGRLKLAVRRNYSSPPTHGMRLVSTVLGDISLKSQWTEELNLMRTRIVRMRSRLHASLTAALPERNFDYIVRQNGMFAYTGLSEQQVSAVRDRYGIYAVSSGRICVAGLNDGNVDYVAEGFAHVMR
jgi:aromatic-amino-acid transaminase